MFKADNTDRPRVCIVAKGLDTCLLTQFSNGDLIAIKLKLKLSNGGFKDLIVGSVYMPYDRRTPPQKNVIKLVIHAKEKGLDLLLGCDANSRHIIWRSTDINPRGESLFNFIIDAELYILNKRAELTFLKKTGSIRHHACTRGMVNLVVDLRVSSKGFQVPSKSDHRQIRSALGQIQKENKERRNPKKTD